jgi:2-dehydropantoate 2-reductase
MLITIVGAGALGQIYGVLLAATGSDVAFLVRSSRAADTSPFVLEQLGAGGRRDTLDHPTRVTTIPPETDIILVTVRFEQLLGDQGTDALIPRLRATRAPIVVLTPLLAREQKALEEAIGRSVVPAMPAVAGYVNERGFVRYWVPPLVATLMERREGEEGAAIDRFIRKLEGAGLNASTQEGVVAHNTATTIAFFPIIASIDPARHLDALLADEELCDTMKRAAVEANDIAKKVGKPAPWAGAFAQLMGTFASKAGIAFARQVSPEAVHFMEEHFGPKLHDQHLAMGAAILEIAREHGVATPNLEQLLGIVRERGGLREHS